MAVCGYTRWVLVAFVFLGALASGSLSHATIFTSGDISPTHNGSDPWFAGSFEIGRTGAGVVIANGGSRITGFEGTLGALPAGDGQLSLSGFGSELELFRGLTVGGAGMGQLSLSNSALATVDGDTLLGFQTGSSGSATVSSAARWLNNAGLLVGQAGAGDLRVQTGGVVESEFAAIGDEQGGAGLVTVTGFGSRWTNRGRLEIGAAGAGTLRIESSGLVEVEGETFVRRSLAAQPGASGRIEFASGGVLQTQDFYAGAADLRGVGTVNTGGVVTDAPLLFDATHGLQQSIAISDPGTATNVTINFDAATAPRVFGAGYLGQGSLMVRDGVALPSQRGFLGYLPGSNGAARVEGVGSQWNVQQDLVVGFTGSGSLEVAGGGVVTAFSGQLGFLNGSSGSATVSGSGSRWELSDGLGVGQVGPGDLSVIDGGRVISGSTVFVGASLDAGDTGVVELRGAGSGLEAAALVISQGTVEINDQATADVSGLVGVGPTPGFDGELRFSQGVLNAGSVIAGNADLQGVGTINARGWLGDRDLRFDAANGFQQQFVLNSLPGQDVTVNLDLTTGAEAIGVGYRGAAELTIADGRVLRAPFSEFGFHPGSEGTGLVTGPGTRFEAGELGVGRDGDATLRVEGGAVVTASESRVGLGAESQSAVLVTGPGSRWETAGRLIVGSEGTGRLDVRAGAVVTADTVTLGQNEGGMGDAVVIGEGSLLETARGLAVGVSGPSELRILDQGLVKVGDRLTIGQRFTADPSQVRLHSGGQLAIPGQHDSSLFRFLLEVGSSFDALEYWDGSQWDSLDDTGIRDVDFTLEFQATGDLAGFTLLTVGDVVQLPGDYNDDGRVDAADYATWRDALGLASNLANDIHGGTVGESQFETWRENFGATLPPAAAVPEPSAAVAALLCGFAGAIGFKRRRR